MGFRDVLGQESEAWQPCIRTVLSDQHFLPETEIAEGGVWTGRGVESHFWNVLDHAGDVVPHRPELAAVSCGIIRPCLQNPKPNNPWR